MPWDPSLAIREVVSASDPALFDLFAMDEGTITLGEQWPDGPGLVRTATLERHEVGTDTGTEVRYVVRWDDDQWIEFLALPPLSISDRLAYLRRELRAERISQAELLELQSPVPFIAPGDVELLEAAGVEEVHRA